MIVHQKVKSFVADVLIVFKDVLDELFFMSELDGEDFVTLFIDELLDEDECGIVFKVQGKTYEVTPIYLRDWWGDKIVVHKSWAARRGLTWASSRPSSTLTAHSPLVMSASHPHSDHVRTGTASGNANARTNSDNS